MKREFKITQLNFIILIALLCLAFIKSLFAENATIAPQSFKETAQCFAKEKYNGIVDYGIPYYSLDEEIVSWVFTIYQGPGLFPSHNDINDSVLVAYELRRQAEAQYQAALDAGDEAGAESAKRLIEKYWANMRNRKYFATIFVMGDSTRPYVGLSYASLPLHYVSIYDAIEKGKIALSTNEIIQGKFIFVNHLNVYVELIANNHKVYGDLLFPEENVVIEFILPEQDLQLAKNPDTYFKKERNISSIRTSLFTTQVENKLEVPAYSWWRGKGCGSLASTMVLAYHYNEYYDEYWRLLDDIKTSADPGRQGDTLNGEYINGWKGLDTELGAAMSYREENGIAPNKIVSGIETVCNDPEYHNYYNFQASDSPDGISQLDHFNKLINEIDQGRPILTHFSQNSVLVRFNADTTVLDTSRSKGMHTVADIGYRYEPGWEIFASKRWHICNWGLNASEDPWFICDSTNDSEPMYVEIQPGQHQGISGVIDQDLTLNGVCYLDDDVYVDQGATLTIAENATLNLVLESNNSFVKSIGGNIILNGKVIPDLRLKNSTGKLTGLYGNFQQAFNDAAPNDTIIVNAGQTLASGFDLSNINVKWNGGVRIRYGAQVNFANATYFINSIVEVEDNSALTITGASTLLQLSTGNYLRKIAAGILSCDPSVSVQPYKIYTKKGAELTGLFCDAATALNTAQAGEILYITEGNFSALRPDTDWIIKCYVVLENGASLVLGVTGLEETLKLEDEILIKSGAMLTLQAENVEFSGASQIIIEPGGVFDDSMNPNYTPYRKVIDLSLTPPTLVDCYSDDNVSPWDPANTQKARITFQPVSGIDEYLLYWDWWGDRTDCLEWRQVEFQQDELTAGTYLDVHQYGTGDRKDYDFWLNVEDKYYDATGNVVLELAFPTFRTIYPYQESVTFKMRSIATAMSDFSEPCNCTIVDDPGEIDLVSPVGGEQWHAGTKKKIKWQSIDFPHQVKIFFSSGDGWQPICGDSTSGCGRKLPFFRRLS